MQNKNTKLRQEKDVSMSEVEEKPVIIAESEQQKPLLRNNFFIMAISIVMIIIGFALMSGSGSGLDEYNPEIFSARRIVVGPLISFLGFVLLAIGIIVKPKSN